MTHRHQGPACSRRTALGRLGLTGLSAVLSAASTPAPAAADDRATHPMVGHWLATTPLGPTHVVFDRDGTVLMVWPHSDDVADGGFSYTTSATGIWQPVSARGIHFAVVQIETEIGGEVTGTTSLESIVVASADGRSFRSGGATSPVAAWASVGMIRLVVRETAMEPALSGIRMWAEMK